MQVINKILNLEISNFFWLLMMRKISRFYKIYFIPTNKKNLPLNNHPVGDLRGFFEHQFSFYCVGYYYSEKDLIKIYGL